MVGYSPWGRKESDTTERLHSLANSCEAENGVLPTLIPQAENSKVQADENTSAPVRSLWTTNQMSYSSPSSIRSKTFSPLKLRQKRST